MIVWECIYKRKDELNYSPMPYKMGSKGGVEVPTHIG